MLFTPRLERAAERADYAHAEQIRKGNGTPYITHPFAVMCLLAEHTRRTGKAKEDLLIAALLHDTVEDVPERYSADDIEQDFGHDVLTIVLGVTKDSEIPDWFERNTAYLEQLWTGSEESVELSLADKVHNLMTILRDYEEKGEAVWNIFKTGKEAQLWWYRSVLEVGEACLPGHSLVALLRNLVDQLEDIVEQAA
jgi:(p)ppGpp synthase/HD superfamily hydrolase